MTRGGGLKPEEDEAVEKCGLEEYTERLARAGTSLRLASNVIDRSVRSR